MISRRWFDLLSVLLWGASALALFGSPGSAEARQDVPPQEKSGENHGHKNDVSVAITDPVDGATVTSSLIPVTVTWSVEPEAKGKKKPEAVTGISLRLDGKDVAFFSNVDHLQSGSFTFQNVDLSAHVKAKKPAVLVARALLDAPPGRPFKDSDRVRVTVAASADVTAPQISALTPAPGSFTSQVRPAISATVTDTGGSGVDAASIVLKLDGAAVAAVVVVSPDFSSATVSLTPGTALPDGIHSFTVDARDRAGNAAVTAGASFTIDTLAPAVTAPSPADGATAPSATPTISASWSDSGSGLVPGSASVILDGTDVTTSALIGPAGFTFLPPSPLSSGTHGVTARIRDQAGNTGSLSWSFLIAGPPPAPTGLVATAGNSQVSLSWTASAGALSYKVFRALTSGGYNFAAPLASGVPTTAFTDATAVNGTTYFYVVEATNPSGDSGPSNERSATPQAGVPAPPTNLVATAGNAQVSLTWTASAGALSYKVFRAQVSNGYVFTSPLASGVPATSTLDLTAVNGTTYFYVVEATGAGGDSGPSNEVSATPIGVPDAPVLLSAVGGDGSVSLGWTATSGASSYKVFRSTTSGNYPPTPLASGLLATSFNDATAVNGTTYFYVVRGTNAAGDSPASNERSATPTGGVPAAPVLLSAVAGDGTVSLQWTAPAGAVSFKIFRSTVSGSYGAPAYSGVVGTAFAEAGLTNGTTYFYVVRATNAAGDSPASNERSATPTAPTGGGPPAPLIATPPKKTNDTTLLVRGTSEPGATITVFFSGAADGTTTADASGAWTYHNLSSFKGEGSYRITATATNAQGTSGSSAGVQIQIDTTPPDVPTNLQAAARDSAVVLTWSASVASDLLGYNIYRKGPLDSEFRKINAQVVTGTHYSDSGLTNGSLYEYRISAVDDTMNEAHP